MTWMWEGGLFQPEVAESCLQLAVSSGPGPVTLKDKKTNPAQPWGPHGAKLRHLCPGCIALLCTGTKMVSSFGRKADKQFPKNDELSTSFNWHHHL